ncbi:hypothetical protein LTR62_000438 [Meristemomyces frigidus]|uniref:DUF2293 domain-containing protein n=1 Tax=Meristemomyces frigidus TaxID=1508187 RepID=A0AAN7YSV9_9PEZI|nr:hypothetical protein LTR62_000438 [Meristemomyces frigidus]
MQQQPSLSLSPTQRLRRREWNRGPLNDLFPRIPAKSLETLLDKCADKNFTYQLSQPKTWNARRLTAIAVAHVRHNHSDYEQLLREDVERFEARARSAGQVWRVLREWCPWDDSNEVLDRCFRATLVRVEERGGGEWDPMDVDEESEVDDDPTSDPMDLD